MKAVIPAAGLGTRFLPIAKAVPKEMLPLGNRPVIHYVVQEASLAGFDEILIILGAGKESIPRYFTPDPALERHLETSGKTEALEQVRAIHTGASIHYTYQTAMRGLGDAVLHAETFVGDDPCFAVLLGDTVMHPVSPLPDMRQAWETENLGSVCIEPCAPERVGRYGICGGDEIRPGLFSLDRMVEKPPLGGAPALRDRAGREIGHHAFAARYLFPTSIFELLRATPPGLNSEIQLTDAMETLRSNHGLLGVTWPGTRLDIGNPDGLLEAALAIRSKP